MTDPIRRALRTLMMFCAAAVPVVPTVAALFDVPAGRVAQIVAVFTAIGGALTYIWNQLEDTTTFPALLKSPPSGGVNPVPEDAEDGSLDREAGVTLTEVCLLVVAVIAVLWACGVIPR